MKRFLYGIFLLVILCPVKLQAQKFLTPATDFGSPEYQDRLYRELLYDDHHQPFGERGHIFEAFYLALPDAHGNPNPTPPEYAFVVKDSMIVMKRAKSNINDALFAQNRIKYHYIKGYDAEQQHSHAVLFCCYDAFFHFLFLLRISAVFVYQTYLYLILK